MAQPIPGPHAQRLQEAARKHHIHVAAGLVERAGNRLFNAGVLIVTFGLGRVAEAYGYPTLFLLVALLTASGCPLLLGQMRRRSWLVPPLRD